MSFFKCLQTIFFSRVLSFFVRLNVKTASLLVIYHLSRSNDVRVKKKRASGIVYIIFYSSWRTQKVDVSIFMLFAHETNLEKKARCATVVPQYNYWKARSFQLYFTKQFIFLLRWSSNSKKEFVLRNYGLLVVFAYLFILACGFILILTNM